MASYTPNYGLHQWVPEDDFLRTDFNEDLSKLDTALGAKCEMCHGAYVGDGADSQFISLGFTPKAVLVAYLGNYREHYGGLAVEGYPATLANQPILATEEGGMRVYRVSIGGSSANLNYQGTSYFYLAFR